MNEKIADKITGFLMEDKDDRLTYLKVEYFIEMFLSESQKIITIFLIFLVIGYGLEIATVFAVIFLVRRYCGGNHFDTSLKCFMFTLLFCTFDICVSKLIVISRYEYMYFMALSANVVFMLLLAPVKSPTRFELKSSDVKKLRIKGIIGLGTVEVIYIFVDENIKNIIFVTLALLVTDALIAGKLKGYTKLRRR